MQVLIPKLTVFMRDVFSAYWTLLKIMVPALIIVRLLEQFGVSELLAVLLSPFTITLGLPDDLGLVWAAAILTNLYTAMVVFYGLAAGQEFTLAQMSVLGVVMLISHALPIEGSVARALNVPWGVTLFLRLFGAYVLGLITYWGFELLGLGQQSATILWQPSATENADSWLAWSVAQVEMLVWVLVILSALMAGMRFLRLIGVEYYLSVLLSPLTHLMNVDRKAGQVTIIGLLLGLSFGAGLLIAEARKGTLSKRDMRVVTCFLGLCHSVVEDTLLMMLLGAHIFPLLFVRLVFSCLVIWWLARYLYPKGPVSSQAEY